MSVGHKQGDLSTWLLLLPGLLLLAAFVVAPLLLSAYFSFTNEHLLPRPVATEWVGWRNYLRVLGDGQFWQALANTCLFALVVVPAQITLSLAVALLLNSRIKGLALLRTIAVLPLLVPMTVVAVLWAALLQTPDGLLNSLYQWLAATDSYIDWLGDEDIAMLSIALLSVWASFPLQTLIYLAGLQDIPRHHYDCASLEGFSSWQRLRYITLPGLRRVHVFVFVVTTIGAFSLFTQVNVLTDGGPNGATNTLIHYMFDKGFEARKIGLASAVAVMFFIAVAAVALLQTRLISRTE